MSTSPAPEFRVSKARLETLLDGVFAIAMTLMVLEIKIPELSDRRSMDEFASAMKHNVPGIVSFLLSMGMLGLFWYRHHRQYHFIDRITPGLLGINLAFLSVIAFFPFSAGVIGKYPVNLGVYFVYLPNVLLIVLLLAMQWIHARHFGLLSLDILPREIHAMHIDNILGLVIVALLTTLYLGGILLVSHHYLDKGALIYVVWLMLPMIIGVKFLRRRLRFV